MTRRGEKKDAHGEALTSRRIKPIMGHRISRAFNYDMGNRKANPTMVANGGNFTSHQMTVCRTSITNTKMG